MTEIPSPFDPQLADYAPAPEWHEGPSRVYVGDCVAVMRAMPEASVDSIVTDPPYGLALMGKGWDDPGKMLGQMATGVEQRGGFAYGGTHSRGYADNDNRKFQAWCEQWTAEAFRVLKPGGHLVSFGATRTWHRLAVAIEDAGFEIRDHIGWIYGQGFPKSRDVAKDLDRLDAVAERRARSLRFTAWMQTTGITAAEINSATETAMGTHYLTDGEQPHVPTPDMLDRLRPLLPEIPSWVEDLVRDRHVESANWQAREVQGMHTKAAAAATWRERHDGTSAPAQMGERRDLAHSDEARQWQGWGTALKPALEPAVLARKPYKGTVAANLIRHGVGALNIGENRVGDEPRTNTPAGASTNSSESIGDGWRDDAEPREVEGRHPANVIVDEAAAGYLDRHGTAPEGSSRVFYVAKASKRERAMVGGVQHATVKPLALMRHLVRLVTPHGGVVLDPFAGSGSTAAACQIEGFDSISIELEADHVPLILHRLGHVEGLL